MSCIVSVVNGYQIRRVTLRARRHRPACIAYAIGSNSGTAYALQEQAESAALMYPPKGS